MAKGRGKLTAPKVIFYSGTVIILIAAALSLFGFASSSVSANSASLWFTICFSLLLSFAVVSYMLHKGKRPRQIVKELGLSREALSWRTVGFGILLFIIYLAILFGLAAVSAATGTQINSNVQQTIGWYPLWALIFLSIIAPLNEEIAFRGFLVPRKGVIASGIIFAVLHFGYGSWSEIVVALWFGITGGYVFKKTKSLYPTLITHIMVNTITVITVATVLQPMLILVHL
jgi:membrane protease YdiL (CAAX protease family)